MPETLKVLGQLDVPVTTLSALYTVPALTSATVSTLVVCNRSGSTVAVRVSVAVGGAVDDPKQYLMYGTKVLKDDQLVWTIGMTLAAGDVVRVYSDTSGVSFTLFGVEIT